MVRRTLALVTFATLFSLGPAAAEAGAPKDDWPRINGELWINGDDHDTSHAGTAKNDELLGGHGDDRLDGRRGHDVIWGDHKASGQPTSQNDKLRGGRGHDWIYASHGWNDIHGGPGHDTIRVWFGRGFVDCGPGRRRHPVRQQDPEQEGQAAQLRARDAQERQGRRERPQRVVRLVRGAANVSRARAAGMRARGRSF